MASDPTIDPRVVRAKGTRGRRVPDPDPMALMNQARSYIRAAMLLQPHLGSHESDGATPSIWDPAYFLSIHAIDLGLKAFLLSRNIPIAGTELETHLLSKLYDRCLAAGLSVAPHSASHFKSIAESLDTGNEGHNWRYYNATRGGGGIEPAWAFDEAAALVELVRAHVEPLFANEPPGPVTKINIIATKPK